MPDWKSQEKNLGFKEVVMRDLWSLAAIVCFAVSALRAQDPVKVAPKQCKVEFENEQVRVLRWKVGPHEKTPMHEHPAMVSIALTAGHTLFTLVDGKTGDTKVKAGQATWSAAQKHSSENLGGPSELIQVELKGK
jgi:quercetin dioxygenase-like cupin family protein